MICNDTIIHPIHVAIKNEDKKMVKLLLKYGLDLSVSFKDCKKNTFLLEYNVFNFYNSTNEYLFKHCRYNTRELKLNEIFNLLFCHAVINK